MTSPVALRDTTALEVAHANPSREVFNELANQFLMCHNAFHDRGRTFRGKNWKIKVSRNLICFADGFTDLSFEKLRSALHVIVATTKSSPQYVQLGTPLNPTSLVKLMQQFPSISLLKGRRSEDSVDFPIADLAGFESCLVLLFKEEVLVVRMKKLFSKNTYFRFLMQCPGGAKRILEARDLFPAPMDIWVDAFCLLLGIRVFHPTANMADEMFRTAELLDFLGFPEAAKTLDRDMAQELDQIKFTFCLEDCHRWIRRAKEWDCQKTLRAMEAIIRNLFVNRLSLNAHFLPGFVSLEEFYHEFKEYGFLNLAGQVLRPTPTVMDNLLSLAKEIEELFLDTYEDQEVNPEILAILNRFPKLKRLRLTRLVDTAALTNPDLTLFVAYPDDQELTAENVTLSRGRLSHFCPPLIDPIDAGAIAKAYKELATSRPLRLDPDSDWEWELEPLSKIEEYGVPIAGKKRPAPSSPQEPPSKAIKRSPD